MGHFSQRDAQQVGSKINCRQCCIHYSYFFKQELEVYDAVVDVRCYELAALFLCSVFVPKCGSAGQVVRPCRSLCFGKIKISFSNPFLDSLFYYS